MFNYIMSNIQTTNEDIPKQLSRILITLQTVAGSGPDFSQLLRNILVCGLDVGHDVLKDKLSTARCVPRQQQSPLRHSSCRTGLANESNSRHTGLYRNVKTQ